MVAMAYSCRMGSGVIAADSIITQASVPTATLSAGEISSTDFTPSWCRADMIADRLADVSHLESRVWARIKRNVGDNLGLEDFRRYHRDGVGEWANTLGIE